VGGAWILLESRKNLKPENCLKIAQTPTRPLHALLGSRILRDPLLDEKKAWEREALWAN
jgi:hypothetical protein